MPATPAETDPSVCYRHPDRSSWTLCERCGRTICPECQILTPAGVRCPDCVRETGGSVKWQPAAGPKPRAKKTGMRRERPQRIDEPSRLGSVGRWLLPRGGRPVISITILALMVVTYIAGFATANLPILLLTVRPDAPWQVWGYATSAIVYPAEVGLSIASFLLQVLFFVLAAPRIEIEYGRARFLGIFLTGTAVSAAILVLAGGAAFGIGGGLWALFGSFVVVIWDDRAARTQYLIILGVLLIFNIIQRDFQLPGIIAAGLAGVGAILTLRRFADRPGTHPRTPVLVIAGVIAVLIVAATLRALADLGS